MLKTIGLAAALLAAGIASASAQYRPGPGPGPGPGARPWDAPPPPPPAWSQGANPYARHHHGECHRKAWRLRQYERYATADGRLSWGERRELAALRRDLDRTCGRYRWRG